MLKKGQKYEYKGVEYVVDEILLTDAGIYYRLKDGNGDVIFVHEKDV